MSQRLVILNIHQNLKHFDDKLREIGVHKIYQLDFGILSRQVI